MPAKSGSSKQRVANKKQAAKVNKPKVSQERQRIFNEPLTDDEIQAMKTVVSKVLTAERFEIQRTDDIHEKLVQEHRRRLKTANLGEGRCAHCGKIFLPLVNQMFICTICHKNIDKSCLSFDFNKVYLCKHCQGNTKAKASTGSWYFDYLKRSKIQKRLNDVHPLNALSSSLDRIDRETHKSKSDDECDDVDPIVVLGPSTALESPMKRIGVEKIDPADIVSEMRRDSTVTDLGSSIYKNDETKSLIAQKQYRKNPRLTASEFGSKSTLSVPASGASSMTSIISGVEVTGRVLVSIDYISREKKLKIFVNRAEDLTKVNNNKAGSQLRLSILDGAEGIDLKEPNSYVKIYLLPDRSTSGKRKTHIIKKSCNPKFLEELSYHLSESEVRTRTINLSVWHSQGFGHNKFLGEFNLELDQHHFDPEPCWFNLHQRFEKDFSINDHLELGEISVALKFENEKNSSTGNLHVWIKSAKDLTSFLNSKKVAAYLEPVAKVYLIENGKKGKKFKTNICPKTNNPVWNKAFIYDKIQVNELESRGLQIEVWDGDKRGSENCLGMIRVNIGPSKQSEDWQDAENKEQLIWKTIIIKHNVWAEAGISLRAYLK